MGLEQGNETAGEVQNVGQAPATGVAPSQTPQSSAPSAPAPWSARIGDQTYDEPAWKTRGVDDFKKLHGEYTRSRQEFSKLRDESAAGMELLEMVKADPALKAEVQRRLQAGQSPEQAVQGAVQNDPRIDQMAQKLDAMEQNEASRKFRANHPDLTPEDEEYVIEWLGKHTDRFKGSGWTYDEILELAYKDRFMMTAKAKEAQILAKGQEMKEQEIQKGRKSQLLGTPAPTAQAREKTKKSTLHATPAERLDIAMEKFQANKRKG